MPLRRSNGLSCANKFDIGVHCASIGVAFENIECEDKCASQTWFGDTILDKDSRVIFSAPAGGEFSDEQETPMISVLICVHGFIARAPAVFFCMRARTRRNEKVEKPS